LTLPAETSEDLYCPQCGYNVRGVSSERCPECGLALDRADMLHSRLPWTHRKRIGNVRAYWRTLILGTFSTPQLADELARPVSFRDAQLFRFITILIGWAPLAIAATIIAILFQRQGGGIWRGVAMGRIGSLSSAVELDVFWPLAAGATFPGVIALALAIFLIMMSGIPSYFFHPRSMPPRLQNRGVAMSYYACAAIAFLPFALIFFGIMVAFAETDYGQSNRGFPLVVILSSLAFAAPFILLFIWWVNTLRLIDARRRRASEGSSAWPSRCRCCGCFASRSRSLQ
jgi:hypothetical protein